MTPTKRAFYSHWWPYKAMLFYDSGLKRYWALWKCFSWNLIFLTASLMWPQKNTCFVILRLLFKVLNDPALLNSERILSDSFYTYFFWMLRFFGKSQWLSQLCYIFFFQSLILETSISLNPIPWILPAYLSINLHELEIAQ